MNIGRWFTLGLSGLALMTTGSTAYSAVVNVDGFSWAENLVFDHEGGLFASDATTGEIWRIALAGSGEYERTLVASGFSGALGLAFLEDGGLLYAAVSTSDDDAPYQVVSIDLHTSVTTTIVSLPYTPNGLEADPATGLLYATTEGNFIPGQGEVYEINPETTEYATVMSGLWAADGAAIDVENRRLYVGEVISGWIHILDLDSGELLPSFRGLKGTRLQFLDDFEVLPGGTDLIGADFAGGDIVRIPIGEDLRGRPDVLAKNLTSPTAVVIGRPPHFSAGSIFVAEGGGITSNTTDRRVIEFIDAELRLPEASQ